MYAHFARATRLGLLLMVPVSVGGAAPLWSVLSDNATGDEPAIETGVTYTADPPFDNPADTTGRRLLDRGGAWDDWNNTVGINWKDQTLVFDLQAPYRLGKVQLLLDMPAKPAYVDITVAQDAGGPWEEVGRITPEERTGWYELVAAQPPTSRYVRMFFKLKEWGWYLREVKLWGWRGDEPGPDVALPVDREGDALVLVRDGSPRASIIVAAEPSAKALRAARDLQEHIRKMSGATLPVRPDDAHWTGTLLLVGPSRYVRETGVATPSGYPGTETVVLKTVGDRLVLIGNDDGPYSGTEFAVQMLLERLGCGWFGPDPLWQPIPQRKTVTVEPLDIRHSPPFSARSLWIGLGKRWYLGGVPINCGHAHSQLFPPDQYFAEHPEYYALIGGKRTAEGEWQLCTSNPDVIRLTIEKARAFFDNNPTQLMLSLSNNDCGGFCECADCAKSGSNPGARMLAFANAVARGVRDTHPNRWVVFLAYWYTAAAPQEPMKAEPGVAVMVVGSGCHAHPLTDALCPNVNWTRNFERWAATGAKMAVYEWYIPGCSQQHWRRLPWVAGETACRDLSYWQSRGVEWITYETQTAYEEEAYPLRWPLFYVAAKRMWDPSLSADEILNDACQKLFGPAAQPMRRFYRELEHAMRNCPEHGGIWNLPDARAIYIPAVIAHGKKLLEEAARAAETADPDVQERIAAEARIWQRAEATLQGLDEQAQRTARVAVNGQVYVVDKETMTGKYARDLGGIPQEQRVVLVTTDAHREVGDGEQLKPVDGMEFRSVPR